MKRNRPFSVILFLTMKTKTKKAMSDDLKMMCEYLPKSMRFKTKSERLVCAVMMFYANRNKSKGFEFSIPISEIEKITCIGRTTVSNAVNKLVDDGVFEIVCKGNSVSKKATLYRLNRTVKRNSRVVDSQGVMDDIELFGNGSFDNDEKVNSNRTVKRNSRVIDSQGVTSDIELFGNGSFDNDEKVNSNRTVKRNSRVVDSQGVMDDIELFGKTDGVEQKVNTNYNFNYKYKKYDNKEYGLTTINDNKRNEMIVDVNNVSVERLLNALERLVVSVDTMNRNIDELKTIVSQQGRSIDCLISRVENINNRTAYSDNKTISTPEDVCVVDNARSLVSEIEDKNSSTYATTISNTEETDYTVTPRSYFDIISSSPVATGIDIQQQTTFTSSTWVDIDDINDAKASLHSSRGSSTQDRITSLWVEIERGSDFESAYNELQEMFNDKFVTQRQWELTERKYEKRKSSTSLVQNQKKEKEKKVCDTPNKTLMYFPQDKMNEFNDGVLNFYNACKTALEEERNEGKAFDEEKYIKAFNLYAQNFMELSNDTDDDNNRYGDYQYLKSKVYMNPFTDKCNADTKAICERYQSIQAKKQAVVNA